MAGAFLKSSQLSFTHFLQLCESKWNVTGYRARPLREYRDRTLYTTWNISLTRVEQEDPEAAQLLKLLAYFDNQNVWFELLRAGSGDSTPSWFAEVTKDIAAFENVMSVLVDYCLVETRSQTKSYGVHICIHDWILNGLNPTADMSKYSIALNCTEGMILAGDWENLSDLKYRKLVGHAVRLGYDHFHRILSQTQFVADNCKKFFHIAEFLRQQEQHRIAELMYEQALFGYERVWGVKDERTLNIVHGLGYLYENKGKLGRAERMYQRALAGKEKVLGSDHTSTLRTVNNLGNLYAGQGKLGEAERMHQRALAGREGPGP
jgi:tetratricopeptide (TPR) repeat protein